MKSSETLEYWYQALRSSIGIVIATDSLERLRQKLYIARRDAEDPSLERLTIVTSPTRPEDQLWIVKQDATDD